MSGALVGRESQRSLVLWTNQKLPIRMDRQNGSMAELRYTGWLGRFKQTKALTPPLPRQGTAQAESNCALSVRNRSCQRVAEGRYGPIEIGARHTLAAGCGIALRDGVVVKQNPRMGVDIHPHGAPGLSKGL
jgi:hypothetical protein